MSHYEFRQTTTDTVQTDDDYDPAPVSFPENGSALVDWLETARLERLEDYSRDHRTGYGSDKTYTYDRTDYGYLQIHEDYDLVTSSWYDSQRDVANAWAAMEFPRRNADSSGSTRLQCSANFEGIQHADGSGVLRHYRTTEAWRTRSGLIINNADCWSRGFAHCTPPRGEIDVTLSRTVIDRLLREGPTDDTAAHIVDVYDHDSHRVLSLESGGAIVFWTDPTAHASRCAVVLERGHAAPHAQSEYATILRELEPRAVRHHSLPVRDADAAGDDPEIPGGYILRQGEWFFIPCDSDFEPDRVFDPDDRTRQKFLGNHEPRDFGLEKTASKHNIYVRGWVSHPRDHERAYLGERWYYACESPIDHVRVLDDPEHVSRSSGRSRGGMRYD